MKLLCNDKDSYRVRELFINSIIKIKISRKNFLVIKSICNPTNPQNLKNLLDLQFVFVYEQTPGTVFRSKVMIAEKRIILFETKAKSGKSSLY